MQDGLSVLEPDTRVGDLGEAVALAAPGSALAVEAIWWGNQQGGVLSLTLTFNMIKELNESLLIKWTS